VSSEAVLEKEDMVGLAEGTQALTKTEVKEDSLLRSTSKDIIIIM